MTLEDHALVQLAMAGCLLVFVTSFAAFFYLMLQVIGKFTTIGNPAYRKLSWGDRAARGSNDFNSFLIADEFRLLRKRVFATFGACVGSFLLLLLLTAVFGKRIG